MGVLGPSQLPKDVVAFHLAFAPDVTLCKHWAWHNTALTTLFGSLMHCLTDTHTPPSYLLRMLSVQKDGTRPLTWAPFPVPCRGQFRRSSTPGKQYSSVWCPANLKPSSFTMQSLGKDGGILLPLGNLLCPHWGMLGIALKSSILHASTPRERQAGAIARHRHIATSRGIRLKSLLKGQSLFVLVTLRSHHFQLANYQSRSTTRASPVVLAVSLWKGHSMKSVDWRPVLATWKYQVA